MPVFIPLLIIVAIAVVAVLVFGVSASMIGYGLLKTTAKFGSSSAPSIPQQPPPPSSGWTFVRSPTMPQQMWDKGDGTYYFDFPSSDGVHMVVRSASGSGLAIGKTLTIKYSISGTGTVLCVQTGTPGWVTAFMQEIGDDWSAQGDKQQYRYYGHPSGVLTNGDYTLVIPITADKWSDVMGIYGTQYPNGFANCVSNAMSIGVGFGDPGQGATAHGAYVVGGNARFTLKSFTIT